MPREALWIYGIMTLIALAGFIYFKVTLEGPRAQIIVVNRRTMRLAERRIPQLTTDGDLLRANATIHSLLIWLRGEIHIGPRRHRVAYASALERWELYQQEIHEELGLAA